MAPRHLAGEQGVERLGGQLGGHVRVAQARPAGQLHVEQRLEVAGPDAADRDDLGVDAALVEVSAHRVEHLAGPGRQAAGPHADVDDGARAGRKSRPARLGAPAAALKRAVRSSSIPCSLSTLICP